MKRKIEKSGPAEVVGYGTRHGPSARGKPAVRGKPQGNKIRGKPTTVKMQLNSYCAKYRADYLIRFWNRSRGFLAYNIA